MNHISPPPCPALCCAIIGQRKGLHHPWGARNRKLRCLASGRSPILSDGAKAWVSSDGHLLSQPFFKSEAKRKLHHALSIASCSSKISLEQMSGVAGCQVYLGAQIEVRENSESMRQGGIGTLLWWEYFAY